MLKILSLKITEGFLVSPTSCPQSDKTCTSFSRVLFCRRRMVLTFKFRSFFPHCKYLLKRSINWSKMHHHIFRAIFQWNRLTFLPVKIEASSSWLEPGRCWCWTQRRWRKCCGSQMWPCSSHRDLGNASDRRNAVRLLVSKSKQKRAETIDIQSGKA